MEICQYVVTNEEELELIDNHTQIDVANITLLSP